MFSKYKISIIGPLSLIMLALISWGTIAHADITNGLIARWMLDDISGTTVPDSSGQGNAASIEGTFSSSQISNRSFQFNGTNNYFLLPSSLDTVVSGSKSYSISMWVNFNSYSGATLMSVANSTSDVDGIGMSSSGGMQAGHLSGSTWDGYVTYYSNSDFNKWHHVVLVNNAGTVNFYYDNTSITGTGSYLYTLGSSGSGVSYPSQFLGYPLLYKGSMADVRVYDRALSAAEVSTLYAPGAPNSAPPSPIVSIAADSTTAGYNNTVYLGGSATLTGTGSYFLPNTLTYSWSEISGPANGAKFSTSSSNPTTVTFTTAGTYTIQLQISDGTNTATGTFTLTQSSSDAPPPPVYVHIPAFTATINSGGTGYVLGDTLTITQPGASGTATVSVAGVSSGVITAILVKSYGSGYSTATGLSVSGGSGSGAKLNLFAVSPSVNTTGTPAVNTTLLPSWAYYTLLTFPTTESAKCFISQNAGYSTSDPTMIYDVIPNYNSPNLTFDNSGSSIFYLPNSSYGYGNSHYFPINNLTPGQSYSYYEHCVNGQLQHNPMASSPLISFQVAGAPTTEANIDSLINTFVYFNTAIVQWNTDRPTDMTSFEYSTDPSFPPNNTIALAHDYALSVAHGVTLTGLTPGTTYYYQFSDTDKNGVVSSSTSETAAQLGTAPQLTTLSTNYAAQFFVSPTGFDGNAGTSSSPVATLEAAATLVSNWRKNNPVCNAPVIVNIAGGSYYRSGTFEFTNYSNLNGTSTACPTIFSGTTTGAPTVLSGGVVVNDSKFAPLTDPNIIARFQKVHGSSWVNNIYTLNLNNIIDPATGKAVALGDFNGINSGTYSPMEVIYNGNPLTLSQYPAPPQYPLDGAPWPATFSPGQIRITSTNGSTSLGFGSFPELSNWSQPLSSSNNQIWAHGWFSSSWMDGQIRIVPGSITSTSASLSSAPSNGGVSTYDQNLAGWFYFENILEEVDSPGQYYIDRDSGTLYLYPSDGPNITSGSDDIEVTMNTGNMFHGSYVSNVIFQNMTIQNTRGYGFYLGYSNNFSLVNLIVRNLGGNVLYVTGGGQNSQIGVYHSHLYNIGAGGINIYSADPSFSGGYVLTGDRNFVVDNKIHNTGRWLVNNQPVGTGDPVMVFGNSPYVAHNEVYDALYLGMQFYATNNGIMEYNNIHDVMKMGNDGGGIYINGANLMMGGNIFKYNYLHDINGVPDNQSAEGIYCDDSTPDCHIYGNILDTIAPNRGSSGRLGGAFMIGGGRFVNIENNIINNAYTVINLGEWNGTAKTSASQMVYATGYPLFGAYFPEADQNFTVESPDGTRVKNNIVNYNTASKFFQDASNGQFWEPYVDGIPLMDPVTLEESSNLLNTISTSMSKLYQVSLTDSEAENTVFHQIPFGNIGLIDPNNPTFMVPGGINYGDVNGDGQVNIYDAELIAQYLVGESSLTSDQQQAAMVSSNTEMSPSIYDAYLIAQYSVGSIHKFPAQE